MSLDPVILFFLLGLLAGLVRAELRLPAAIYDFLSMLLLLTIGLKGEHLSEMAELVEAGCVAFSQANTPILDTRVLGRALDLGQQHRRIDRKSVV